MTPGICDLVIDNCFVCDGNSRRFVQSLIAEHPAQEADYFPIAVVRRTELITERCASVMTGSGALSANTFVQEVAARHNAVGEVSATTERLAAESAFASRAIAGLRVNLTLTRATSATETTEAAAPSTGLTTEVSAFVMMDIAVRFAIFLSIIATFAVEILEGGFALPRLAP